MDYNEYFDFTKRYPNERVQVFIDQSNLYKSAHHSYPGCRIDYKTMAMKLIGGRKPVRVTLYVSTLSMKHEEAQAKKQEKFLAALTHIPFFSVKKRPLRYSRDKKDKWEKGVDILVATDLIAGAFYDAYDSLVLISGDGDFAPVLEEIKKTGKRVENAFFSNHRSKALADNCDIFIALDEIISDCSQKKPVPSKDRTG